MSASPSHEPIPTVSEGAPNGARLVGVEPAAPPEVVAALAAAAWECWPRPVLVLPEEERRPATGWRFSGRWWAKPTAVRRDRPWAFR